MSMLRALLLTTLLFGCAGDPGAGGHVTGPFTEHHAVLFDDSVDMVENPQDLGGRWLEDWERELDERFAEANLIAHGRVVTLRTDNDLQQRTTFHLVLATDEVLEGEYAGKELSLRVGEGSVGYANVERNREQMLNRPFVAFVRWYNDDLGRPAAHFHLSPPSRHLMQRLERLIAARRPSTVRVIERTN